MVVSCQKGNGRGFKVRPILRMENGLFLLPQLCPKRAQLFLSDFGSRRTATSEVGQVKEKND